MCYVLHGDVSAVHCDIYRVSIWISTLIRDCTTDICDGTEAYLIIMYKRWRDGGATTNVNCCYLLL